ncbi:MAG: TRAP transporter substrate-binding protein [Deltaproteobacteria bacterium]|nr:TRAP transporter substrate-binding protein [Deltaproteobacteria bacterium]
MKKKRGFLMFVLIVSLGAFFLLSAATVSAKPIEIGYSNFFPPTHWQAKLGQSWADEVEKRTNGKVKITYYPGGALLKGPKIYDGILKGITDMGMSVFAYSRGVFPAMAAFDLPMGYLNGRANTFIVNDFYNTFKPKELSKVKVLYLHAHGPGLLLSKRPVRKLEDFKGLKVRGVGSAAKEATALGAVPVSMGMGGVYEALQKGVVDATFGPPEILKGWKHAEVIKYVVKSYSISYSTAFYVAMNMDKWNSLPKDVQKVMEEVSLEWIGKHGKSWDTSDVEGLKFSASLGNEVITFSDAESARMAEAVKPVIDAYIKKAEGKGLPGRDYVDTIEALIRKYK